VQALVAGKMHADPDFWSGAASIELGAWNAFARNELAQRVDAILRQLADLHDRVARINCWRSLHDQTQFLAMALRDHMTADEKTAAARLVQQLAEYSKVPNRPK